MIEINFEIGGKTVRPNNIKNTLEKQMMQLTTEHIKKQLSGIKDPVTGERPKVIAKGKSLDRLSFEVHGSEELKELVSQKLKG